MATTEHTKWLRANGHDLASLTGTDRRALDAIAACWTLYAVERDASVLDAVRVLVKRMQPKTHCFARALIPWAMDWSDETPVWARVVNPPTGPATITVTFTIAGDVGCARAAVNRALDAGVVQGEILDHADDNDGNGTDGFGITSAVAS